MNDDHLFQKLTAEPDVLSVSQLNARARQLLEDVFPRIWVEGELSNLSRPSSGHMYFTLKDDRAQIRCALFRQHAARVRLAMRDGQQIRAPRPWGLQTSWPCSRRSNTWCIRRSYYVTMARDRAPISAQAAS